MSEPAPPANTCPQCGAPVAAGAPEGLCPRCVAALNLYADTAIPPVSSRTSTAIRFLKWAEFIELKSVYSRFRKQESTDAWIFVENREAKGPVSFNDILLKLREGHSPLVIIHESKAYDEVPTWSELVYNPVWSRPFAALAWTIGFWISAISVGFISLRLLLPAGMIRTLGSFVYCLLLLGVGYTRTKPHLTNWSACVRKHCARK